ncbi:MAG: hypothetical protein B6247_18720 [Candidatus Parabeggiatoa sp. nov. 2]|nr:MAG: hypothetical protein B6247_18720 [Beggiatoa sp. 4572_84]
MNRNQAAGIQLERINIEIKNLLPNSLLTSPIFDLDGEDLKQENGLQPLKPVIEIFLTTYLRLTPNEKCQQRV